jgi:hypothetical protein
MLYEALAGEKPFSGTTPVATAFAIRHETPRPLAERRADLPSAIVAAVEKAMAREPADRFATAAAMATALGLGADPTPRATDETVVASPIDATQVIPIVDVVPVSALVPTALSPPRGPRPGLPGAGVFDDRRKLLLVAGAGLILALLLLGIAAAAGGSDNNSRGPQADDVRRVAGMLSVRKDGPAAEEAHKQLDAVAASIDKGTGAAAANAFLGQLARWRDAGQLTPSAVAGVSNVLFKLPGVQRSALSPPTTAAAPPTQPPTTAAPEGKKKKDKGDHQDGD